MHLRVVAFSALAGLLAAGCSADITRFDGKGYGLTDSNSATIPPQGMRRGEATKLGDYGTDNSGSAPSGGAYYPPPSSKPSSGVRSSSLPEPIAPATPPPAITSRPTQPHVASNAARPAPAHPPVQAKPIAAGSTIEVAQGDTLYGLAKKHAVPVNELMSINNLTAPTIKPGQKLVLPASRSIARAQTPQKPIQRAEAPVRVRAIAQPGEVAAPVSPIPVAAPSNWTGTHTVRNGESIYAIAKQNRVSFAQLQQVNGITDPTKVRAGTVLKVPAGQVVASTAPETIAPPAAAAPATGSKVAGAVTTTEPARISQTPTKPVIINSAAPPAPEQKVAAVDPTAAPEAPAVEAPAQKIEKAAVASGKFRWPVKGRVIAAYGPRNDSTHNDGINIAVPQGTEVLAAEQGTVAYAGSELKGYGNLILLRHDNGYVTAYAHNEEILVKRGDKVKRGQPIAKAGKTGTVDQPQVHFEIRQGQKPIDPMPHMERL